MENRVKNVIESYQILFQDHFKDLFDANIFEELKKRTFSFSKSKEKTYIQYPKISNSYSMWLGVGEHPMNAHMICK